MKVNFTIEKENSQLSGGGSYNLTTIPRIGETVSLEKVEYEVTSVIHHIYLNNREETVTSIDIFLK